MSGGRPIEDFAGTWWRWAGDDIDPEQLTAAALEAPRCTCLVPMRTQYGMCVCGREIREPGTLARAFRKAAYSRRLQEARGAGLCPHTGFRGLSAELGLNPELGTLDEALSARVGALEAEVATQQRQTHPLAVAA